MKSNCNKIVLVWVIACLSLISNAQVSNISGIINKYAKVDSIAAIDKIIVDSIQYFADGDTVLLVQMKGAAFTTLPSYDLNGAGRYEFVVIETANQTNHEIIFRSNLLYYTNYNAKEGLQLVKIPTFKSAKVAPGGLTCAPWNGIRGGVLAFMVDSVLELNGNIDVTGKGFLGAKYTKNTAICPVNNGSEYYFSYEIDKAGLKGDGILTNLFTKSRGIGSAINGGGGGYGKSAGGGGGGNWGEGGFGGYMDLTCTPIDSIDGGGLGGIILKDYYGRSDNTIFGNRVFMGGGGGAGTGATLNSGTNGGEGGGLVYIIARKIVGNSRNIISKGGSVIDSSRYFSGSGGGGGGGFVLLSVDTIKNLSLDVSGGAGGRNNYCSGLGGGGGGGYIWFSRPDVESLTINWNGGARGSIIGSSSNCPIGVDNSTNGTIGDTALGLNPVLNGFLYNTISISQKICYGETPRILIGSLPRGGDGKYKYQWQKRKYKTTTWAPIGGANSMHYQPGALTDSTEFRRIVKAYEPKLLDTITDAGKIVLVSVIPDIKSYLIAADTTICRGLPKITLRGETPIGGDGSFSYKWESNAGLGWNIIPGATGKDCPQTSNTATQYYRRKTFSNICFKTSNEDSILILPVITGNAVISGQTICYNYKATQLKGNAILGGGNTTPDYTYKWEKSVNDSLNWQTTGITTPTYDPGQLINKTYYRRIIFSGLNNTCKDTSLTVKIDVTPAIIHASNTIAASPTKCTNEIPDLFNGNPASGGNNSYKYQWESSLNLSSWDSIKTDVSLEDYQHTVGLANTTYFRRIVRSGLNDCCLDTSPSVTVTIQPLITNNRIKSSQEICENQTPQQLTQLSGSIGGGNNASYNSTWESAAALTGPWNLISGANTSFYSPPALTQTIFYRRKVESGACKSFSDTVKINVLKLIAGNTLTGKNEVCRDLNANPIAGGAIVTGGENGVYRYSWQDSVSGNNWSNITLATFDNYSPGVLPASKYFRRIIKSGLNDCCESKSQPFYIQINELPIASLTNQNTAICDGSTLSVGANLAGNAPFDIILYGNAGVQYPKNSLNTGLNNYLIAPSVSDSLTILSVTDTKGCLATSKTGYVKVRLITVPVANAGQNAEICGLQYQLNATPSVGSGLWIAQSGSPLFVPNSAAASASVSYTSHGIHKLWWRELNEICSDSAEIMLTFYEQPIKPRIGNDTTLSYQFNCELSVGAPNAGSGVWNTLTEGISILSPNSLTSEFKNLIFGKNEITYSISNGNCITVSDTIQIIVDDIKRYTGFSPNGDNDNEYFVVDGLENAAKKTIKILNRWGAVVFSSNNYDNKWNGTNNKGEVLPDDTYFYILILDDSREYKGFIVLKR